MRFSRCPSVLRTSVARNDKVRIVTLLALSLAVIALGAVGLARGAAYHLGPAVRISSATSGNPLQAWAHADPGNDRDLIVCGDVRDPANDLFSGYVYASTDGGTSWRRTLLDKKTKWVSEESCNYGPDGTAYFIDGASNYYNGAPHHETGHMQFYVSHDGGATWRHTWTRKDGWLDWTSIGISHNSVVVFANEGTDRLGHWAAHRPVAITSENGGRSFSGLVAPQAHDFKYVAIWTGENVTLPGGVILFATSSSRAPPKAKVRGWALEKVAVEIFAYDPSSRRLSSRAVLRMRDNVPIFTAAIAQDQSGGRFNGRLYAAWVESTIHGSSLWLATSDDQGYHWRSRVALSGAGWGYPAACTGGEPVDEVELATTGDGRLGIAWVQNNTTVRFSVSDDGGAIFSAPVTLARVDASQLVADEAIGWNDYWMYTALAQDAGKASPQAAWLNTPGLGIVAYPSTITDLSLVGNGAGGFQAFWVARSLMTRGIDASKGNDSAATLSEGVAPACASVNANGAAHPVVPAALPKITVPGARDVTDSIAMDAKSYSYDPATHAATIDGIVINRGKATLRGHRFILVAVDPHSDVGDARITNSQMSIDGQASWDITDLIPPSGLAPGAQSKPLHLTAIIANFRQLPTNYLSGDALAMAIKLYVKP